MFSRLLDVYDRETPPGLHTLSVALHHVGRIHYKRDNLDDALTYFTETVSVYRRLRDVYGPPLASDEELANLSEMVEHVRSQLV